MSEPETAPVSSDQTPPSPAPGRSREVLVFAIVTLVAAVAALALLLGRRASSEVSAAQANAARATTPVFARPASTTTWNRDHAAQWLGHRPRSAAFELPADNIVAIWLGRVRPILVVRCVEGKAETFVFTGSAIKIEPNTDDHTVTFGLDGAAEITERWPDSAEHDALFAPDGAQFARRLMDAHSLRFGYTPHNAAPVVAEFHVANLAPLVGSAARECGWKPQQAADGKW